MRGCGEGCEERERSDKGRKIRALNYGGVDGWLLPHPQAGVRKRREGEGVESVDRKGLLAVVALNNGCCHTLKQVLGNGL